MGVSEVLLCPNRCLEYKMERLEKLKIQLCFYSRFLIILLPNRIYGLVMQERLKALDLPTVSYFLLAITAQGYIHAF